MGAGGFFSLFILIAPLWLIAPLCANDCTRDRSHFRSAIASVVQSPCLKFPFFEPRGAPGLMPPCFRFIVRVPKSCSWDCPQFFSVPPAWIASGALVSLPFGGSICVLPLFYVTSVLSYLTVSNTGSKSRSRAVLLLPF